MTWQLLYLKTIATNKKIQLQNTHPTSKTSCQAKRNEDKYHSTQSASLAKLQMMTVVSVDMDVGQPEYRVVKIKTVWLLKAGTIAQWQSTHLTHIRPLFLSSAWKQSKINQHKPKRNFITSEKHLVSFVQAKRMRYHVPSSFIQQNTGIYPWKARSWILITVLTGKIKHCRQADCPSIGELIHNGIYIYKGVLYSTKNEQTWEPEDSQTHEQRKREGKGSKTPPLIKLLSCSLGHRRSPLMTSKHGNQRKNRTHGPRLEAGAPLSCEAAREHPQPPPLTAR